MGFINIRKGQYQSVFMYFSINQTPLSCSDKRRAKSRSARGFPRATSAVHRPDIGCIPGENLGALLLTVFGLLETNIL